MTFQKSPYFFTRESYNFSNNFELFIDYSFIHYFGIKDFSGRNMLNDLANFVLHWKQHDVI